VFWVNLKRGIQLTYLLLTPIVAIIVVAGGKLLLLFGSNYSANSVPLLSALALSVLPTALTTFIAAERGESASQQTNCEEWV
jgi:O-antigen/teichoic acid export membrane protein